MFREELFGTDLIRLLDGKNLDERAPRQSAYTAVRSLYTAAAYEKSADIFRMMMLFIGKEPFIEAVAKFLRIMMEVQLLWRILLNQLATLLVKIFVLFCPGLLNLEFLN